MDDNKMTFENAMQRLDLIVRLLEQGDAPLDQSLALFEEGSHLLKLCNGMLDDAEQKIMLLQKGKDDAPVFAPFARKEDQDN